MTWPEAVVAIVTIAGVAISLCAFFKYVLGGGFEVEFKDSPLWKYSQTTIERPEGEEPQDG